jgi:hypothetical protein
MDQTQGLRPVMLMRAANNRLLALPLCETDAHLGTRLVGERLEIVLRRKQPQFDTNEPIVYGRKVAAGVGTRAKLKQRDAKSK